MLKFIKICLAGCGVVLVCWLLTCWADLDKIPHRDEGILAVETLTTEGEVTGVGSRLVWANGRHRRSQHNISVYLEVIDTYTGARLTDEELVKYEVGDIVEITREVWYLKPGFRIFTKDFVGEVVG